MVFEYVLNDIQRMNKHSKNQKINNALKSFIQAYICNHTNKAAQKCLQLMVKLYKRDIWTDTRTVNIISQGCLSQSPKIRMISAFFLLQSTEQLEAIE